MKTLRKTSVLSFVLLVIVQASLVKSETKYQCNGHDITLTQAQVDGMKKCGEQIGIKSMEEMTPDKIPCFAKCVMETSGLVDGEGKPHTENIMRDIDASVPKEMQDVYKKSVEKCIEQHGHHLNPKDTTCAPYGPMAMCVTAAFKSICHG